MRTVDGDGNIEFRGDSSSGTRIAHLACGYEFILTGTFADNLSQTFCPKCGQELFYSRSWEW